MKTAKIAGQFSGFHFYTNDGNEVSKNERI